MIKQRETKLELQNSVRQDNNNKKIIKIHGNETRKRKENKKDSFFEFKKFLEFL